jgi:outer membrane protein TolC
MTHPLPFARTLLIHALAAVLVCPVLYSKPKSTPSREQAKPAPAAAKGKTAPAAKPARKSTPLIRQNQGDAPADPSLTHRSLIVPPEELLARVPASGPLNEEHCILLAIGNNIQLKRRRADILTAIAERQEIKDWRNPELRLGYGSQSDDMLRFLDPNTAEEPVTQNFTQHTDEFSALLRFRTPNPWVKKSQLARASAEIMLAESQYLAEEDQLVRDLRALFQDLAVYESTLGAHKRRRANFAAFRTEMENTNMADFAVEAARANLDMADVLDDTMEVTRDADKTRFELARLCRVDRSRIYSPGIITRRILDYSQLDEGYLIEMAMLYRADVVESRGRLGIARARLQQAKAERIPWSTFFDIGYGNETRAGYFGDEDAWEIRLGIEIPLFDWTRINKRDQAYQQAAESWEKLFNEQRDQVAQEVRLAVAEVKNAYAALHKHEADVKKEKDSIADRLKKVEEAGAGLKGFATNARFKYDAEDQRQMLDISRYRAYSDYNEALRLLEETLGVRIEKVFSGSLSK